MISYLINTKSEIYSVKMDIYKILSSKPHNKHYLLRYIKFINSIKNTHGEKHHIAPKAKDLFPEYSSLKNNPWNCILLSARQHYIAHLILWKTYGGSQTTAFKMMCSVNGKTGSRYYEKVKSHHNRLMRCNNPNKDGIYSKAAWDSASLDRRKKQAAVMAKLNKIIDRTGKNNPMSEKGRKMIIRNGKRTWAKPGDNDYPC